LLIFGLELNVVRNPFCGPFKALLFHHVLCTLFFVINIFYEKLTHNLDGSIPYVLAFKIYLRFLV
jgi:hypothetical protein